MDNLINRICSLGFKRWDSATKTDINQRVVYCWANSHAIVCVGETFMKNSGKNDGRTYAELSERKIFDAKDCGKSIVAAMIARHVDEPIRLYFIVDRSTEDSVFKSSLEKQMKEILTFKEEINIDGGIFKKVNFLKDVIRPEILAKYGYDSNEMMVFDNCVGEGDAWSAQGYHLRSVVALRNIIKDFCLLNDSDLWILKHEEVKNNSLWAVLTRTFCKEK
jgi:hypothetical protein